MGKGIREYFPAVFPVWSLKSHNTSFGEIEKHFCYALFLGKNGHLLRFSDLLDHFWIDEDNIWPVEHVAYKNISRGIVSLVSVKRVVFCLHFLEKLIIEVGRVCHIWQLNDLIAVLSK
jgi:hypothetical protein